MYALHRTSLGIALLAGLLVAGPAFAQSLQNDRVDNPSLIKRAGSVPTNIAPKPQKAELPSFGPSMVLFDAGSVVNSPGTGAGGADEGIEYDVSTSSGSLGYGHQISAGNRVADDFTVPAGGWTISEIVFYGYQSGAPNTGTINDINFRVWDGEPGAPGSTVVYGDDTTNRFVSTAWTGAYRVTESSFCPTGVCSARAIMANTVDATGLSLSEGTYWLDWQSGGDAGFSGPWAPPVAQTSVACPTGNAFQFTGTWNVLQNGGCTTGESLPFVLIGTTGGTGGGGGGGTTVAESGDAPSGWDGTQDATGDVDAITGEIAVGDIADCYMIEIADIDGFSVNTFNSPSLSDPQLYLFSSSLEGILHNDDAASTTNFQAEMPAGSLSGMGLSPGEYVFCVVDYDQDPYNAADEDIFGANIARGVLQGPVTTDTVLDDWNNTTAITPGMYQLDFTGLGDTGGGGGGNVPAMFSGDNTGGPPWDRPFTVGDGTSGSCLISATGSGVLYETTEFSTDTDGTYSIETTYLTAGHDGYIHLYEGSFDPADQCVDLIALDDDFGGTGASRIEAIDLTAGTTYILVVSGFSGTGDDFGPYEGVIDGPPDATITFGGGTGGNACEDMTIAIAPVTDLEVPSAGGFVRMYMEITNASDDDCVAQVWGKSMDPLLTNGVFIRNGRDVTVPANSVLLQGYNQRVPGEISDGDYDYSVSIGEFDELDPMASTVYDMDDVVISKGDDLTIGLNELAYGNIKAMFGHDEEAFSQAYRDAMPYTYRLDPKQWGGVTYGQASIRPIGTPISAQVPTSSYTVASGTTVGPNPFRGETTFEFDVQEESLVSLQVFDVLGRLVATPVEGQLQSGRHTAIFSGRDLQAGTYVYRLQVGDSVETGRVTLAR